MYSTTSNRPPRRTVRSTRAIMCASLAALLVALAVPALAGAGGEAPLPGGFVPYKSLSAVHIGMKEKAVRAILGDPNSINVGSGGQSKPEQLIYSRAQPPQSLIVTFDQQQSDDPVVSIQGSGDSFRSKGIGIGSTKAALLGAIHHLKSEDGSLIGEKGPILLDIGISHGRASLISIADTRSH